MRARLSYQPCRSVFQARDVGAELHSFAGFIHANKRFTMFWVHTLRLAPTRYLMPAGISTSVQLTLTKCLPFYAGSCHKRSNTRQAMPKSVHLYTTLGASVIEVLDVPLPVLLAHEMRTFASRSLDWRDDVMTLFKANLAKPIRDIGNCA